MTDVTPNPAVLRPRAEALIELRRFDEAMALLRQCLAAEPGDAATWCVMAQAQLGLGKYDAVLQSGRQALSLQPDLEWAHRLRSIAFSLKGNHPAAIREAREALNLAPHAWPALTRLATACAQGRTDLPEAREVATRAIEMAPMRAETYNALGAVEVAIGNRKAAREAFTKALSIDPNSVVAHSELARLHLRRGRFTGPGNLAGAARGYATVIRTDPRSSAAARNLDVVVQVFLRRAAYLILVVAFVVSEIRSFHTAAGRALVLALLAVPGVYIAVFVKRLTPDLRRYLRRSLAHPPSRLFAVICEAVAVALVVVLLFLPGPSRYGLGFFTAYALALVARLTLAYRRIPAR